MNFARTALGRFFLAGAAMVLTGCAGMNYVIDNYGSVEMREVAMPDDTYAVYDKPAEGRMMVSSSLASAAGQGFGKGLLLNAIDTTPPGPLFEAAASRYLVESGRPECEVTTTTLIVQPQFEVKYKCSKADRDVSMSGGKPRR